MTEPAADTPIDEFRTAMHRTADMVADYLDNVGDYPVVPRIAPGDVLASLPASPPEEGEPLERILDDYKRLIEPNVTHWNHPGFLAYFAITGSAPGIIGETLSAALNVNAMLWRTGPAPTELEACVCDWLRQAVGLPAGFAGHINDSASVSTLVALATARHRLPDLDIRQRGMAGRPDLPPLTIYTSEQAHSSIDKAAITLGLGLQSVRRIPVDEEFRMVPAVLKEIITKDRATGAVPMAIVATIGTTSTTSIDPVAPIAGICRREKAWLHIDAAYAGSTAICPEFRKLMTGWEKADSITFNPHKWLFTPIDCSILLVRDPDLLRSAFSVVPEYLRTSDTGVANLMDYGIQLGRRFRALKLWMVIRTFGLAGLRERLQAHCEMAQELAGQISEHPRFELCAPVPFSTVCFRAVPDAPPAQQDTFNERLLASINEAGPFFLSHTKLRDRFVLRVAIGNLKTTSTHVDQAWELIRDRADALFAQEFG